MQWNISRIGIGLLLISSGRKRWRKEQLGRKEGQQDLWQWKIVELICNVKLKSQRQGGLPGAWRELLSSLISGMKKVSWSLALRQMLRQKELFDVCIGKTLKKFFFFL